MRCAVLLLAVVATCFGLASSVLAAALRVSPVLLDPPPGQKACALTLTNSADRPINVQVRVFHWVQENGQERLDPTTDVVVSPPAASLAAHAQHLVRIVRLDKDSAPTEKAYRILIDEIPNPGDRVVNGVTLVLRQSLPVFFNDSAGRPDVSWRLATGPSGPRLVAVNRGDRHLRISELELRDAGGALLEHKVGLLGYVLAGAEMSWPLADAKAASARTLTATTEAGPLHVDLAAFSSP